MRKVLTFCICLFIILLLSPVIAVFLTDESNSTVINFNDNTESKDENKEYKSNEDTVVLLAMTIIEDDFCDESIKAALAIAENNIKYNIENNIDSSVTKQEFNETIFKKIKKLYKKIDVQLSYKNSCVFIPNASLSEGNTKASEEYPYIKSVASPWDCFDDNFIYKKDYPSGVSMNGIDYLCKNGMSYKEALSWYLPEFYIK